jgi:hypothetical protein
MLINCVAFEHGSKVAEIDVRASSDAVACELCGRLREGGCL